MNKGDKQVLRGYKRLTLIDDIVKDEMSEAELAEKYEVTQQAINAFKKRNKEDIDQVRANRLANIEDEFAALWSAKKKNRIAEYERIIAEAQDKTEDEKWAKVEMAALKSVAEELGQLKQSLDIESTVHYTIDGVDPTDLR